MELEFNWKYKDYELRAVPKELVRYNDTDKNYTIELLKWNGNRNCFTIAYWRYDDDGYELQFVGNRFFEEINEIDIGDIRVQMRKAQQVLDKYFDHAKGDS